MGSAPARQRGRPAVEPPVAPQPALQLAWRDLGMLAAQRRLRAERAVHDAQPHVQPRRGGVAEPVARAEVGGREPPGVRGLDERVVVRRADEARRDLREDAADGHLESVAALQRDLEVGAGPRAAAAAAVPQAREHLRGVGGEPVVVVHGQHDGAVGDRVPVRARRTVDGGEVLAGDRPHAAAVDVVGHRERRVPRLDLGPEGGRALREERRLVVPVDVAANPDMDHRSSGSSARQFSSWSRPSVSRQTRALRGPRRSRRRAAAGPRLRERVDRPALEHELHALIEADADHGLAQQRPGAAPAGAAARARAAVPSERRPSTRWRSC